jgi:hypothetical protein
MVIDVNPAESYPILMDIAERKCFLQGAADACLSILSKEAFIEAARSLTILSLEISARLAFLMLGIISPYVINKE